MKHSTSGTIAKNELMLLRQSLERGVVQQGMSPKIGKNSKTQKVNVGKIDSVRR